MRLELISSEQLSILVSHIKSDFTRLQLLFSYILDSPYFCCSRITFSGKTKVALESPLIQSLISRQAFDIIFWIHPSVYLGNLREKLTAVIKKYDTCVVYKTLIQTSFISVLAGLDVLFWIHPLPISEIGRKIKTNISRKDVSQKSLSR